MASQKNITGVLHSLWGHLSSRRKKQFAALIVVTILTSLSEVVSIGAIVPFLFILTSPEKIVSLPIVGPLFRSLASDGGNALVLWVALLFGLAAILAGSMRLLLIWASAKTSFGAGADLSYEIYRRTLYQPYKVHISRNSSELVDGIINKSNVVVNGMLMPAANLVSAVIMLIFVITTLLLVNPKITLILFSTFALIYILVVGATRKKLAKNGMEIAESSPQVVKVLQEGLGAIRDILLDHTQEIYCEIYRKKDALLRKAQGSNYFISNCPRYATEALGMLTMALVVYFFASGQSGVANLIPILGLIALAAQRLLPVMQQAYSSWTYMKSSVHAVSDVLELLKQKMPASEIYSGTDVHFNSSISLKDVSFRYAETSPWVLKNLNLTINKGDRIGIVGASGAGKSTITDIMLGILEPEEGFLLLDHSHKLERGELYSWQKLLAHVPQSIYLTDASVAENIAFGIPKDQIDYQWLWNSAKQAHIHDVIMQLPDGYETQMGERGVRLSGGQRQRIGIARALYKKPSFLIFDEATSALDGKTELAIMETIENLSRELTIITVAHRASSLTFCNRIYEISGKGQLEDVFERYNKK